MARAVPGPRPSRARTTSKNLLSCWSWLFSVRSWVTTLMASATMLALSVLGVFPGSRDFANSMKLHVESYLWLQCSQCCDTHIVVQLRHKKE